MTGMWSGYGARHSSNPENRSARAAWSVGCDNGLELTIQMFTDWRKAQDIELRFMIDHIGPVGGQSTSEVKTARALVNISQSLVLRADEVIQ